jgi:hypothetical protein
VEGHTAPTPELLKGMEILSRSQRELIDQLYVGVADDVVRSVEAGRPQFFDGGFGTWEENEKQQENVAGGVASTVIESMCGRRSGF